MDALLNSDFISSLYDNLIYAGRMRMLLRGLLMTLQISAGAVVLGVTVGLVIAFFKMSGVKLLKLIADAYIDVIRGTPAVTQLLIINFTIFASVRGAGLWVGIVAMGINSGAYVAEIIRAGVLSIDVGQTEAGRSLGFSRFDTMRYIVMPQAIKNILPALCNEFIVLIKETAIVGYIAVEDLTKMGQIIVSRTLSTIPLFATAILYFIIIKILTYFFRILEKRLRASDAR